MTDAMHNVLNVLPELLLIVAATAFYVAAGFAGRQLLWSWGALAAIVAAGVALLVFPPVSADIVRGDTLAVGGKVCFLVAGLLFVGLSWNTTGGRLSAGSDYSAEYYATLLLVVAGTMLVACAGELVLLFLGLELISIPTYLLLYLSRHDRAGEEAATKYFFLSVFSSALLLYGFSLLYGLAGSTRLSHIAAAFEGGTLLGNAGGQTTPLATVAIVFVFAGLGFKVAAVPFHFYSPDVYQGSTPLLAGLLAFAPKAAGFVALLRGGTLVMAGTLTPSGYEVPAAFLAMLMAVVTMTGGNVLALLQQNLRRLLAYSSIAHAGYLLVAVAVGFWDPQREMAGIKGIGGNQAVLFYLVVYALATIGIFGALAYLGRMARPVENVDDLAGLGFTHPLSGLAVAVFLFSLTGIPPLAGFWGKLGIFYGALAAGSLPGADPWFYPVAAIGMINAAIAAYYYLRIVAVMYLRGPAVVLKPAGGRPAFAAVMVCAVLTVAVGLFPRAVFNQASLAAARQTQALPAGELGEVAHRSP